MAITNKLENKSYSQGTVLKASELNSSLNGLYIITINIVDSIKDCTLQNLTINNNSTAADIKDVFNEALENFVIKTLNGVGKQSVGSSTKFVYMNENGVLTESNATVGSSSTPIYLNNGVLTASNATVGNSSTPIYLNNGVLTASNATVGNSSTPIYLNNGVLTPCSKTLNIDINGKAAKADKASNYCNSDGKVQSVGGSTKPIYINDDGVPSECGFELKKTVPADAIFTDTTYSLASSSNNGLLSSTLYDKINRLGIVEVYHRTDEQSVSTEFASTEFGKGLYIVRTNSGDGRYQIMMFLKEVEGCDGVNSLTCPTGGGYVFKLQWTRKYNFALCTLCYLNNDNKWYQATTEKINQVFLIKM